MKTLTSLFPILSWAPAYTRTDAQSDLVAAAIVTIMLVPQSLAYAMLAGLPPQVGLYASILPLIAYAIFGTSRALAVGPVAVASLMTAAAVGQVAAPGSAEYLTAAITLAFLSGLVLKLAGGNVCAAAGVSGQFPEPSGDLGLYHSLRDTDCHQPA